MDTDDMNSDSAGVNGTNEAEVPQNGIAPANLDFLSSGEEAEEDKKDEEEEGKELVVFDEDELVSHI